MAPSGAFEGNLNTIQELLGIPRAQAATLLQKYGNVEQAVNQYFEDPINSVKPQAPPGQWVETDNLPKAGDTTELPTMSRPPSRADVRAADTSLSRLPPEAHASSIEEMQDLQRAIAMSKQDLSGQETGIVESGQQFGPANRPYYDANQWAMTTIASSREIVDHPPPSKRQRLAGRPAFLRGTPETGYLAPLLNIYHNIPLAREAFLLPSLRVLSYGHDPQWWSGTSDENIKSISVEASEGSSPDRQNFLAELQCLMAFLDGTSRAYGSVEALADLRAMNVPSSVRVSNSDGQVSRLLETWIAAAMTESPDNQLTQVFTSTAVKASDTGAYPPQQKDLVCLQPPVRRLEGQTLVNMLDSTIWDDVADRIDDIWIQQCGEVFTLRLYDPNHEDKGLGLEIPAEWYPDRYMYDYREVTRQWRREMLAIRHEINQCNIIQRRCEMAQGPGKRVIKIRDVLDAASKLAVPRSETAQPLNGSADLLLDSSAPDPSFTRAEEVQDKLRAILQRIDEKVQILEARKKELQAQIRSIASQLTKPTADSTLSPSHKYLLQGLSTKPNITYIRRRKGEPQTLIDTTIEDSDDEDSQWWRIVWGRDDRRLPDPSGTEQKPTQDLYLETLMQDPGPGPSEPFAIYPIDEAEVLEAARTESNSIVLVYANENAMNITPSAPSAALRKFIEQDNRTFQDELGQESSGNRRRYSQETNTTIMEDVLFDNRSATPSDMRETTPMSTTSPTRDVDGQPSPKRAKGDESYVYREPDLLNEPPPYEGPDSKASTQEKKFSKIGILADQMLEKYGGDGVEKDEPVHIEHAKDPLR